jgi:hypothetical protein
MRLFAAAMFLVLSVACGKESPTAPVVPNVVGTWTLRTIGGQSLPVVLDRAGSDMIELMAAEVVAAENGTFTTTSTERTTIGGQATSRSYAEDGRYALVGADVTFTFTIDNSTVTGALRGDSLTFAGSGTAVVYRRR